MTSSKRKRASGDQVSTGIYYNLSDRSCKEGSKQVRVKRARSDVSTGSDVSTLETSKGTKMSENHTSQNVRVVARLRPLSTKEKDEHSKEKIKALPKNSTISVDDSRKFEYDAVFAPGTAQSKVYHEAVGDTIQSNIFKGFNVTILAYGQTGSGKTYTMGTSGGKGGPHENQGYKPNEDDGIIPRAVFDLFETRQNLKRGKERVKIAMSYLEIYNEEARDLFSPDNSNTSLYIRDSKSDGVYVQNLTWNNVESPNEVSELMESAAIKRATAATHMNAVSSRSHAICTLTVTIAPSPVDSNGNDENPHREEVRSKLTLVDLAGSERIKRTGAEGSRMKEGININKGLFVLGQVVSSLSELGQQQHGDNASTNHMHIPYRDSKLTRLLQDSLGGNSRTILVACVSPADSNVEESINTLRYAQRARNIKNSVVRNVTQTAMSHSEAAEIRRENEMLKIKILELESRQTLKIKNAGALLTKATMEPSISALNIDKLEVVAKLRTKCALLESKVEQLSNKKISADEDALTASLKADRLHLRLEQVLVAAEKQGVELPTGSISNDENTLLIEQMRKEMSELKSRLQEEMTDAAVARATAAAVIASDGNLTSVEENAVIDNELECHQRTIENNRSVDFGEEVAHELAAISGDIEQKEAMAKHLEKEKECMEVMRSHFEAALENLQKDAEALTTERDKYLSQKVVSSSMRSKIKELEKRIKDLNDKASEHKKSLRMRELAEKKCIQLASEIQEDKKRRASLQRQLKKEAEERRSEQMAARQQAVRLLRDSNRLKVELQKVKDTASRQAAVLKRKAAEALSRQKKAVERERKRNNVLSMKSNSIRRDRKSDEFERKQAELVSWLDQEIEISLTRLQTRLEIEEQSILVEDAMNKLEEIKNSDTADKSVIRALNSEVETWTGIIRTFEKSEKEFCKSFGFNLDNAPDSQQFSDASTWSNLSRSEAKGLFINVFKRLIELITDIQKMNKQKEEDIARASVAAVAVETRKGEEKIIKMKISHSEAMAALLGSTKTAMEQAMRIKMSKSEGAIDHFLNVYLEDCNKVGEAVKNELNYVKQQQDGIQHMLKSAAKGCLVQESLSKTKKKNSKPLVAVDESFVFEEDEDLNPEDSDDSDWSPDTPVRRRRPQSSPKKANTSTEGAELHRNLPTPVASDDVLALENLNTLKVVELKDMLKQRGLAVSGKKSDLVSRLHLSMIDSKDEKSDDAVVEIENQILSSTQTEQAKAVKKMKSRPKVLRDLTNEANDVSTSERTALSTSALFKRSLVSSSKPMVNAKKKTLKRKNMSLALDEAFLEFQKLQESDEIAKRRK